MIDHYAWSGGREAMLRFGPDTGPLVIVAPPLFEEANRVRAFVVTLCRALAKRGVASVVPDLPGQGESLVPTALVSLAALRAAFDALGARHRRAHGVALRSGALLPGAGLARQWRLSPLTGAEQARELRRIAAAARIAGGHPTDDPVEIAGNLLSQALLDELESADIAAAASCRTVRLQDDPAPADRHVSGPPLWRRAEPDNDPALAVLLADDIADWIAACAG